MADDLYRESVHDWLNEREPDWDWPPELPGQDDQAHHPAGEHQHGQQDEQNPHQLSMFEDQ